MDVFHIRYKLLQVKPNQFQNQTNINVNHDMLHLFLQKNTVVHAFPFCNIFYFRINVVPDNMF